jgi:DNA-binding GntR family transcriptional regulator
MSATPTAKPARGVGSKPETLTEQAYNRLEEMVVTLALAPGSVVAEQALSAELGIGRTPIREALQRLAREGLVLVLPRKAIIVTETDPRRQLLVLEVRRELERLLVRASAERATGGERRQFHDIAEGMEAAAKSNDDIAFMRPARHTMNMPRGRFAPSTATRAASGTFTTRKPPICRNARACTPMRHGR